ncbi:Nis1p KNAG_0M02030 [Huiozyma naganishii CBS 8797]|uniref:Uncharacterized protein n=1 Tax=Huiozyma naganishii (strain ATCC MYA-139 / BCRC 22969 / CBS 8797 / KCTC 17520 / NBRC 10181 / NCYC 3082 / Yp74L-3) TaxID=1071383 RepID=J7SBH8_HUIN7|nr:hypothetical protein KNAG_0M02030 [Kazachstania naganishii CBS 8797]CCK73056.1 hypothetical protein KNAG_0M02030 [Kazachstania naganishii CBS 8797]
MGCFRSGAGHQQLQEDAMAHASDPLLDTFTRWSQYTGDSGGHHHRGVPLHTGRRVSRQVDFTNRSEYEQHKSRNKFIFHRGFSLRGSQRENRPTPPVRPKFHSQQGLQSFLEYVDLEELQLQDSLVQETRNVVPVFTPANIYGRNSKVGISRVIAPPMPPQRAPSVIKRHVLPSRTPSVKSTRAGADAVPPRPHDVPQRRTPHRSHTISTLPSRRDPPLVGLWARYLELVILQRTQLRVSLLRGEREGQDEREQRNAVPITVH